MGLCNSTQKSQNDSSPSSEDRHDIRFYTLLQFCDEPSFDIGKIREISHYKEENQPEHEFLLAKVTVVGPGSQSSRWLRIDRSRQEKATSLLNSSSSIFPAKDTVRVATQAAPLLDPPSSRMCSLQYDGPSKPPLADFRSLLRLVHTMSPDYKLWQEQCYWFCNSIMDIMKGQFPTELVLEAAYNRRGKFKNIVYIPGNADTMTHIQRAFMSNLASNARARDSPNQPHLPYKHQSSSYPGGPLPELLVQPPTQPHWANTEPEVSVPSLKSQPSPPVSLPKSHPQSSPPVSLPKSDPQPSPPVPLPKSHPRPAPPVSLPESDPQPSPQEEDLFRSPSNPSNQPRLPYQPSSDPGGPFPAQAPALPRTLAQPPAPPHRVNSGSEVSISWIFESDPQQSPQGGQEDVPHGSPPVSPYSNATLLSNPSNPRLPYKPSSGPGRPLPAQTPAFPRTPVQPPTQPHRVNSESGVSISWLFESDSV